MNASEAPPDLPWLSPTSAARLLACPATLTGLPVSATGLAGGKQEPNAGTLAHRAVQAWIESGVWRQDEDGSALAQSYSEIARQAGVSLALLLDGRLTGARLRGRAGQLRELLRSAGPSASVICETELRDEPRRLLGYPDILITSARHTAVIDIKTGQDAASRQVLSEHIAFQLLFYAHLVRNWLGKLPDQLEVFSLCAGRLAVDPAAAAVESVLARLDAARNRWAAGDQEARPDRMTCRYCRLRLTCQPHWDALRDWEEPDAVEGTVERTSTSATGVGSVLLRDGGGEHWLTHLSPDTLDAVLLRNGSHIRAVRIRPAHANHDDGDEGKGAFRATESTAVALAQ